MTKFEEELKKLPIKTIQHPVGDTKYYASVNVKSLIAQADEEFQELSEKLDDTIDALDIARNSRDEFEREYKNLKSQLQQQALPVVPEVSEWVAECLETFIERNESVSDSLSGVFYERTSENNLSKFGKWMRENPVDFVRAMDNGYTVEKPQLFYIELPNVYGLSDSVFVSKVENGTILEFTKGKDYALAFTEQEIKSIDERYWQFAVPVEDGE